jgi:hypothetical protein
MSFTIPKDERKSPRHLRHASLSEVLLGWICNPVRYAVVEFDRIGCADCGATHATGFPSGRECAAYYDSFDMRLGFRMRIKQ